VWGVSDAAFSSFVGDGVRKSDGLLGVDELTLRLDLGVVLEMRRVGVTPRACFEADAEAGAEADAQIDAENDE
jgi:hypothetical protein